MKLSNTFIYSLIALAILASCATPNPALEALKAKAPTATWDEKSAVVADVTCDGIKDTVMLGHGTDTAWVGIVPGSANASAKTKPIAWDFSVGRHSQGSFCDPPTRIGVYDHNCESAYGTLDDCKPVKGCKAFFVADDECDSFNFFWTTNGEFSWWRN